MPSDLQPVSLVNQVKQVPLTASKGIVGATPTRSDGFFFNIHNEI